MVSGPQESTDKDTRYLQAPKSPNVGQLQRARQASSPGGPQHLLPGSGDERQTWIMGFISGPGQNRKGTISSGSHSRTTQSSLPDSAVRQAVMSLCSPSQRGGAVLSQVGQGDFPLINHRSGPSSSVTSREKSLAPCCLSLQLFPMPPWKAAGLTWP